jgi:hypothetical protein
VGQAFPATIKISKERDPAKRDLHVQNRAVSLGGGSQLWNLPSECYSENFNLPLPLLISFPEF